MNAWEEKIIEQQRAREKGLAKGQAEAADRAAAVRNGTINTEKT